MFEESFHIARWDRRLNSITKCVGLIATGGDWGAFEASSTKSAARSACQRDGRPHELSPRDRGHLHRCRRMDSEPGEGSTSTASVGKTHTYILVAGGPPAGSQRPCTMAGCSIFSQRRTDKQPSAAAVVRMGGRDKVVNMRASLNITTLGLTIVGLALTVIAVYVPRRRSASSTMEVLQDVRFEAIEKTRVIIAGCYN